MSAPFPVRLKEDERALLMRVAAHHDRKPSDLLRHLLRQEARRLGMLSEGDAPAVTSAPAADDDAFDILDG